MVCAAHLSFTGLVGLDALPLISGTSAAGCPIRGCVLQVCHDAVCEFSRGPECNEAPGMTQLGV